MKKELEYVEFSPRPTESCRRVNERQERIEHKNKIIRTLCCVGLAVFVVASFYFFAVALFTYGASF